MSRLPAVTRDALAPQDQAIWDRIAAARNGRASGPFSVLLRVPALADRVAAVGDYFRSEVGLPAADVELAVLATVRELGARYAWARHEVRAQQAGLRAEAIETIRANGALDGFSPRERLLVEIPRLLLRTRGLPDDLFARGLAELGDTGLVELVALVGQYSLIGYVLNSFEIPPPDDHPKTF
jgi:4-carboxymuconolactone decarboxylase